MTEILCVEDLALDYRERRVLNGVNITVEAGRSIAVMGPSGAGKSSLISCVLGLVNPSKGSIRVDGHEMTRASRRERLEIRRHSIGAIFQSGELLSELSALENVMLPGILVRGRQRRDVENRARALLDALEVPDENRTIASYSGGERQRIAVARALINEPRLILADEPTGALDVVARDRVTETIFHLSKTFECAVVVVTHDPVVASQADSTLTLP